MPIEKTQKNLPVYLGSPVSYTHLDVYKRQVYGGTAREELQLNDETMWGGSPYRNDKPEALESLPQVRELIFAGRCV